MYLILFYLPMTLNVKTGKCQGHKMSREYHFHLQHNHGTPALSNAYILPKLIATRGNGNNERKKQS